MMRTRFVVTPAACAAVVLVFAATASAVAVTPSDPSSDVLAAIEAIAPEVVDAAAATESDDASAASLSSGLTAIDVPRSATSPVTLNGAGRSLSMSLPFDNQASDATTESGIPQFDNNNDSTTVPVVREDGTIQVLTVIESPSAPSRYDYTFSVPDGGAMTLGETGAVIITNVDGSFLGGVAPAWAKDAKGDEIATHYEISGNTLTQVVEHSSDDAYPVVADPWLGIQLFENFSRGWWNNDYTYNASVTGLGRAVLGGVGFGLAGYAAGQVIFRNEGWAEWKSVWPAITNKETLKQQYDCHVTAGVVGLPFTGPYNLERARSNYSNWGSNVISHHCNW